MSSSQDETLPEGWEARKSRSTGYHELNCLIDFSGMSAVGLWRVREVNKLMLDFQV